MKTKTKKKNKTYLKAVKAYEEGRLEDAIKLCDECISENLRNGSALNLKGLILYIKGDLEKARNQWKINSDYNDDSIAKNYLFDSKKDVERERIYRAAIQDIKSIRIEDALRKLTVCRESDFNSINVNLALADCYFKKADYPSSSVYVTNVLSLDRSNDAAIKIAKDLKKYDNIKLNINSGREYIKYILAGVLLICICIAAGFTVNTIKQGKGARINNIEASVDESAENEDKLQEENKTEMNDSQDKGETKVEETNNFSELSNSIDNKNYDDVYTMLKKINPDTLTGQNKTIYYNAKQLLEKEGVDYFYKKGYELYINKNYSEASKEFTKGCDYGNNNYLYPHLIFFNAASYENAGNPDDAIKYYEEYYKKYHSSDYIAETVYKLAVLYKNKDIDKAQAYAEEIKDNYSSSMYNNDVISGLVDGSK